MDDAADEIEQELIFLGVTGIEDKLQEGVPDTIESLRQVREDIYIY